MAIKATRTASFELNIFSVSILYEPLRNMENTGSNRASQDILQDSTLSL